MMKTFVFCNNYNPPSVTGPVSWYSLSDSSLTNAGKPFFVPDFASEFEAIPTVAIRINRLGKSISPRFGERYFSEFAPAIHFRAKDLLHSLTNAHLPADRACSFDRSFIMASFMPFPKTEHAELTMKKNGKTVREFVTSKLSMSVEQTIAEASNANTLKIGDLIVPGLPNGEGIAIGDILQLSVGGTEVLTVQIK